MLRLPHSLDDVDLGPQIHVAVNSGSRTFGNTVIAWEPSEVEAAVTVTVTLGGTPVARKKLTPTDNQMTYNGISGQDETRGLLTASFGPEGRTGQLNGVLEWIYQGSPGNFRGFIGAW